MINKSFKLRLNTATLFPIKLNDHLYKTDLYITILKLHKV